MKKLILLSLMSFNLFATEICPDLKGDYHCVFEDGSYSKLRITQNETSQGVTEYGFDYLALGLGPDIVPASQYGEPDSFGWVTKCKGGKLLSIPMGGGNALSEIYLNRESAFTRSLNGRVVQVCPRGN